MNKNISNIIYNLQQAWINEYKTLSWNLFPKLIAINRKAMMDKTN